MSKMPKLGKPAKPERAPWETEACWEFVSIEEILLEEGNLTPAAWSMTIVDLLPGKYLLRI